MRISSTNAAGRAPPMFPADSLLLEADPERRFSALVGESTRRRLARFGRELARLGEELQKMAAAPGLRPPGARARRLVH